MQLERNTRDLAVRRRLGDVTNTSSTARKRKHTQSKKKRRTPRKRARVDQEFDDASGSGDDRDTDKSSSGSESDDSQVEDTNDDEKANVTRAGRHFALNYGLWVKGNASIFNEKRDPKYDEKKRFDTTASKVQGQLRDIGKVLPDEYRGNISSKSRGWISRLFMTGVTTQRSNTSTRLRKVAGPAIFDCSPSDLLLPETRVEKFKEHIGWHSEEDTGGAYSTLDVPILHEDETAVYDIKTCFLNPCLMRVSLYASIIRGPSAATAMLQNEKQGGSDTVITIPNTETMEQIFGMDHTEPGAIAGSAVLAIWTLSGDTKLRERGDKTNIDYNTLFDQYLEILTVGLRDKSRSILNVFREWDRAIFPASESGYGRSQADRGSNDSGNQRAMEALRAEKQAEMADDFEEGGEDDTGPSQSTS
ncbi:hypothetical protein B0H15DRAFT_776958 [Mycena belliarum]|uniref:Uncharacterized protein n=1 Tax=Mycena belliarum TaxID=1033014 RepID=A0AAD6UA37_9AGAR|nr:hypothetical protein B0H15DRAFT_776958 [Mycena belliae]